MLTTALAFLLNIDLFMMYAVGFIELHYLQLKPD